MTQSHDHLPNEPSQETLPWEIQNEYVSDAARERFHSDYQQFVESEQSEPHPDDKFKVTKRVREGMPEHDQLLEAGVSEQALVNGQFTRQQLIDAGYFFVNRLGDGEKGILEAVIPDEESPDGTLDTTKRIFLTKREVEKIYEYQMSTRDAATEKISPEVLRADMFLFVNSTDRGLAQYRGLDEFAQDIIPNGPDDERWQVGDAQERERAATYLDLYRRHIQLGFGRPAKEVEGILATDAEIVNGWVDAREMAATKGLFSQFGIELKTARYGVRAFQLMERHGKINGERSPYLDSGVKFGYNPDLTLFFDKGDGRVARRLSLVDAHVMFSHPEFQGMSQMGGRDDHDQKRLTIDEYVDHVYTTSTRTVSLELRKYDDEFVRREAKQNWQEGLISHTSDPRKMSRMASILAESLNIDDVSETTTFEELAEKMGLDLAEDPAELARTVSTELIRRGDEKIAEKKRVQEELRRVAVENVVRNPFNDPDSTSRRNSW